MLVTVIGYEAREKGGKLDFADLHYTESVTPSNESRPGKDGALYLKFGSLCRVRRVSRDCLDRLQLRRVGEECDISLDVREFGGKQYPEVVDINYQ